MQFESHSLPEDGDLLPLLRRIARLPSVEPRGDIGDPSPFDWIGRLYQSSPEWRDRVDDAFAAALLAEEPLPQRALEQIAKLPVRSFLPRLFEAITGRCKELAARRDTERTDGRSILGSIVHTAAAMQKPARPSPALAHELAAVDRREDGWPFSFLLALPGDVDGLLPALGGVLRRLDDADLRVVVSTMLADGPPFTDVAFEDLGRGPSDVRDRVARAARAITAELEGSRSALSMMSFPDDPELEAMVRAAAEKPDPWPAYAARLGVDSEDPSPASRRTSN